MRGKAARTDIRWARLGITPAHAGKRISGHGAFGQCKDHPRPCGEKRVPAVPDCQFAGSPPPMRGKGGTVGCAWRPPGITPAHAGKRRLTQRNCRREQGSPPPMRGKDREGVGQAARVRITPAHAGKRLSTSCRRRLDRDHPRPCGEKYAESMVCYHARGSPPPMRGKGSAVIHSRRRRRITPAHAGKRPRPKIEGRM